MLASVPEILLIPPKLFPLITEFNKYKYFVIEGGRGSSKTQSVARILLHIADQRRIRVVCGREVQNTIEESVHAVLSDLIRNFTLPYQVQKADITHLRTESTFKFKGFREQGNVSIKGLEGVDIIWVDEAQSITKPTLDIIIPTIRKNNSKLIFTMNRYMRDDAVIEELVGRDDCLHIKINYFENPYCPLTLKIEAETLKNKSLRDYKHIWLGEPLAQADDYLFNHEKLHQSFDIIPHGDLAFKQRVLAIDFAAQGNDQCVVSVLDRMSPVHWKLTNRLAWDEPDTTISTGRVISYIGEYKPDITVIDIGGMGKPVFDRIMEVLGKTRINIIPFDGGSTLGVDTEHYGNIRAQSYYKLREWFDNGWLIIDKKDGEVIKQLEKIKFEYRSNGVRYIQPKIKMKADVGYSPDDADSINMAIWGTSFLGKSGYGGTQGVDHIRRVSVSKRKR